MKLKQLFSLLALALSSLPVLTACMDDYDEPNTDQYLITSRESIGEVNYSIAQLKQDRSLLFSQTNAFEQVKEDRIIEGVVVANDCGGNLYQTLLLRHIDEEKPEGDPTRDQGLVLAVKHTWLTPYFPVGQRVKVNLKGLYVGCYSKLPKIGQPYYTSSGNLRLGPILLQLCSTNVELVGKPNPDCPECKPVELSPEWLRATANRNYLYYPQLVTVRGTIQEADGEAIFAPESLQDAGYGVDRTLVNSTNNTKVTIRTSTQNDISFTVMPQGEHAYTGLLSYYSNWQVQLRSVDDIQ